MTTKARVIEILASFGIRIPDEDYPTLTTFQGVLDYLAQENHAEVVA